ncbi:MAG: hypothetical protein ABJC62_13890 [Frankiaceae bacterium]
MTTTRPVAGCRRLPRAAVARCPDATRPPAAHTDAELRRLVQLLKQAEVQTVAIGRGRHPASAAAAQALNAAWLAEDGSVLTIADWSADAASWLRPARRLTAGHPDAWVLADTPASCAQLTGRLSDQPSWTAARTFGFASLASPDLITLTLPGALTGMTGATSTGGSWRIGRGLLTVTDEPAST